MLFNVTDVAERYSVSGDTVRSWITSNQLAAINVAPAGSKRSFYRISAEALEEFERGRATKPMTLRKLPMHIEQIV